MIRIGGNMKFINHLNGWWELDIDNMKVYNYMGGHHDIAPEIVLISDILELENWHELYANTEFCPLETSAEGCELWVSTDGKYYIGDAHEVQADYLCDIIYGRNDELFPADYLERIGWIRLSTSAMWEHRLSSFNNRRVGKAQYNAIKIWCIMHNKKFPNIILSDRRIIV